MSYEREGWVDDEPARLTGRLEVRPAAELGPIIVCLDTSGALERLCGGAAALGLQRLPRACRCRAAAGQAQLAGSHACAQRRRRADWRSPHPTALLPGPHPLTPPALPLFQLSLAPPPSRLPRRLHVRPARGGGQGGGPGVHARRAPPAASLLPLRVQVGAGAAAWLAAGCRPSTTCIQPMHSGPHLMLFLALSPRSGPGEVMELELGTDAASFKRLLTFLACGFGGGTGARAAGAQRRRQ